MDAETLNVEDNRSEISFEGGKLTYRLVGERMPDSGPVTVVLPGHGGGIESHGLLTEAIHNRLKQQAIIINRIRLNRPADFSQRVIDQEAAALVELLKKEGLATNPVNTVAHSMGALVIEKAAEIAKEQGLGCFDYEKGARTIFISPAGTNEKERWDKLLSRVIFKSFRNNRPKREELTANQPASTGGSESYPKIQDLRLLNELGSQRLNYQRLREIGLKPAIIFYPDDQLFTWEQVSHDPKYLGTLMKSADGLMSPSGMIDHPKESAFHPSQADHYTPNFNVEPTADSIVDYFTHSRQAPNTL